MIRLLAFLLTALCLTGCPARAQNLVVQTCGVLPQFYPAGSTRQPTVDVTGKLCSTAGSSSSAAPVFYHTGYWYPLVGQMFTGAGSAMVAGTMYCSFGYVGAPVVIKALGANVTATASTFHLELAIYSVSLVTGVTTLTLLDSAQLITLGAGTGPVSASVNNTTDTLSSGVLYAFCSISDSTPTLEGISAASVVVGIGSASQTNLDANLTGKSRATAFNNNPILTFPATMTLDSGSGDMNDLVNNRAPFANFQVN